jgi:hypothetical protein
MNRTAKIAILAVSLLLGAIQAGTMAAAADEHDRARAEARPEARGPAAGRPTTARPVGRPAYDGRGQVLDSRYNHGRY